MKECREIVCKPVYETKTVDCKKIVCETVWEEKEVKVCTGQWVCEQRTDPCKTVCKKVRVCKNECDPCANACNDPCAKKSCFSGLKNLFPDTPTFRKPFQARPTRSRFGSQARSSQGQGCQAGSQGSRREEASANRHLCEAGSCQTSSCDRLQEGSRLRNLHGLQEGSRLRSSVRTSLQEELLQRPQGSVPQELR